MKTTLMIIAAFFTMQIAFPGFLPAGGADGLVSDPIYLADKDDDKEEEKKREREKKFEEKKREQEKKFEEKKREQEKKFEEKKREQEKKFEEMKREQEKELEEREHEDEESDESGSCDSEKKEPGDSRPNPDTGKSGCIPLQDVRGNLSNYKDGNVTVCGNVTELLEIPIIKTGAYKLNDGTDTIWVIPSGSVPGKRTGVRVTGKIDVEVKLGGIALGVTLREN